MWILGAMSGILIGIVGIYFWNRRKSDQSISKSDKAPKSARDVGDFYNSQTDNFLQVYGEVIQAFRTTDVHKLLDYQIKSIGFEKGQRVLDAGWGGLWSARFFLEN